MISREVTVNISDDAGRKLATLVSIAAGYSSRIHISYKGVRANAKSIMGVMNLVPYNGDTVLVTADGEDEEEAIAAVAGFFEN